MKIKRSILAPLVVALVALATGGWFLQQGVGQEDNVYVQARLFEEVLHHVSDRFVEELEPTDLYRMAIDGLLQELGDPHTVFMTPEDYQDLSVSTRGEYGGLGIQIEVRDGWITVISPLPATPAERAGLRAGDKIIEVDGESTQGWSSDRAVNTLRGPEGSTVDIQVARPGVDEPIPFEVERADIQIRSVPSAYMLEDDIGYVMMSMFSESSTDELRDAIDRLRGDGMRGLILDLRTNPGGLLDQGVSVADLFLGDGESVVETRSRVQNQNQMLRTRNDQRYAGLPVVVLVSQGSASASEIVAGALQDHDRALIVGEATFGKGSVQTLYPLPGGNFLKLTTARWFTPSGRSIQESYGIDADREENGGSAMEDEIFHTDAGREVRGGGGIHPDLVVGQDTLSGLERRFVEAVQSHGSDYRNAVFDFAVAYKDANPELEPGFTITDGMLDRLYSRLQDAGIDIERRLFDDARSWIARDLGVEIAFATWGQAAARRRANMHDRQVRVAQDLLQEASDPNSLFATADRYIEAHADVRGPTAGAEDTDGAVPPQR